MSEYKRLVQDSVNLQKAKNTIDMLSLTVRQKSEEIRHLKKNSRHKIPEVS